MESNKTIRGTLRIIFFYILLLNNSCSETNETRANRKNANTISIDSISFKKDFKEFSEWDSTIVDGDRTIKLDIEFLL